MPRAEGRKGERKSIPTEGPTMLMRKTTIFSHLLNRPSSLFAQGDSDCPSLPPAEFLALKHESWIHGHCNNPAHSCFSFPSQYLSTKQEEMPRPQTRHKGRAGVGFNRIKMMRAMMGAMFCGPLGAIFRVWDVGAKFREIY